LQYGRIKDIVIISNKINFYCNYLKDEAGLVKGKDLRKAAQQVNRFFVPSSETNKHIIVRFSQVVSKCICFDFEEFLLVTPCVDLNEHD
jgi:uncharacterized membrane protein YvbJ